MFCSKVGLVPAILVFAMIILLYKHTNYLVHKTNGSNILSKDILSAWLKKDVFSTMRLRNNNGTGRISSRLASKRNYPNATREACVYRGVRGNKFGVLP